jgi:death-on-curing protein
MKYLTAEQILFIHARIVDETGGAHGVRDVGLLQAATERPKATFGGDELYPDIFSKAAALMESLARNHPFLDGNKRTAITSTGLFLQINGLVLEVPQKTFERFALDMAVGKLQPGEAIAWLKKYTARRKCKK